VRKSFRKLAEEHRATRRSHAELRRVVEMSPVPRPGRASDPRNRERRNIADLALDPIPFGLYVRTVSDTAVYCLFREPGRDCHELLNEFGITPRFELHRVAADVVNIPDRRGAWQLTISTCEQSLIAEGYA